MKLIHYPPIHLGATVKDRDTNEFGQVISLHPPAIMWTNGTRELYYSEEFMYEIVSLHDET